jgi:PhnB protein
MNPPKTAHSARIEPYLFFDGRCEEAIEFYRRALGAEVNFMMRFKESPEPQPGMCAPGSENKICHATNEAEADRLFAALADGGQVHVPLAKTFFSTRFGMVADRFGVSWMVIVPE